MKETIMLLIGILFILQHNLVLSKKKTIIDPIAGLIPINTNIQRTTEKRNGVEESDDVTISEIINGVQTSSRKNQESGASKRNANQIVNASPWYEEQDTALDINDGHQEETNVVNQCSYTFIVPKSSQQCAGVPSQHIENEKLIIGLHGEVLVAKTEIEEMRKEIIAEKESMPRRRDIDSLQERVNVLQQESRNMDSRVSQLYMQLLHEIINKRDNTLEIQELEKKLLNRTVEMYDLKKDYDRLKEDQKVLKLHISSQSDELKNLRQQIQSLLESQSDSKVRTIAAATPPISVAMSNRQNLRTPQAQETNRISTAADNLPTGRYRNCVDIKRAGYTESGIFNLRLPGHQKMRIWCDFEQDPGGWIVIQRRSGRRVNFYRDMASYKNGFGRPHSDFWLGLENMHRLTNQTDVNFKLHIDMEDWNGRKTFVEYKSFRVESEETGYKLKINHYSGTAGDSLTWHNNMRFTTKDQDNDLFGRNCAQIHHGGWWYNSCAHSNLNGVYYKGGPYRNQFQDGVYWSDWRGGSYSLRSVSMKIRPTE